MHYMYLHTEKQEINAHNLDFMPAMSFKCAIRCNEIKWITGICPVLWCLFMSDVQCL